MKRIQNTRRLASIVAASVLLAACSERVPAQSTARPGPQNAVLAEDILTAEAALRRGDRATAMRTAARIVETFGGLQNPTSGDHVTVGRAHAILGLGDASSVRRALASFDAAAAADPNNIEADLRAGTLFLDKYNAPEARTSFQTVLTKSPGNARALLGMARVEDFEGKGDALATARKAVAADPKLTDAIVMVARMHLEAEQYDSALTHARRALATDSTSVPAWAVLGATAWVTGDSATFQRARAAATVQQPKPAEFLTELAEAAVRQRRYADAVRFAGQAVELDSQSVRALGVLGTNQLRIGKMAEGQRALDQAFKLDAFNLWHMNTLELLDDMKSFRTIERGRFQLVAPAEEAELLALYILPLMEQAYDSLAVRYAYKPPAPVRLEFFRDHADFSVRTVGLTGLGALGVSFGSLLAMDTPSARERGDFNWGSTAWHELTHAFTLGASDNRVPRWLSEGMSVLEERRAGRGWGADASIEFVGALGAGKLRPMSQLNDGFLRPRFPQETEFSYYQASLFCEMVEAQKGAAALPAMLVAYKKGLDTPGVFKQTLGMTPEQVDAAFEQFMRGRFAKPLLAVTARDSVATGPFVTAMKEGVAMLERSQRDSARAAFERARTLFPNYSGDDGPAWFLARIDRDAGNIGAAIRNVAEVTARSETAWEANMLEADLREKNGDDAGAIAALERLIWIHPYDPALHARMATLATKVNNHALAVRERRAAIAVKPPDLLDARYELARALASAGDVPGARRELLGVLEEAPSFEKAQGLLLQLRAPRKPPVQKP
ncbi:MAG: tetratricopeptide repeat protein [Gemmatimonadota bacterium]